jgi:hypothetical protein
MRKLTKTINLLSLILAGSFLLLASTPILACPTKAEVKNFFLNTPNVLKNTVGMVLHSANGNTYQIIDFDPPNPTTTDYEVTREIPLVPTTGTTTTDASCKYNLSPASLAVGGKFDAYVTFVKK